MKIPRGSFSQAHWNMDRFNEQSAARNLAFLARDF